MATIAARLDKRNSKYSAVFEALVALSRIKPSKDRIREAMEQEPDDNSLEALDREWEEAAAFAGPSDQSDCGTCASPQDGLDIKITQ
jgi:nitrate reductase delta subunit